MTTIENYAGNDEKVKEKMTYEKMLFNGVGLECWN